MQKSTEIAQVLRRQSKFDSNIWEPWMRTLKRTLVTSHFTSLGLLLSCFGCPVSCPGSGMPRKNWRLDQTLWPPSSEVIGEQYVLGGQSVIVGRTIVPHFWVLRKQNLCASNPCFFKVCLLSLRFDQRPVLVPVCTNQSKSEEDLQKKKQKKGQMVEMVSSLCFCNSPYWVGTDPDQQGWCCQLFLQGSTRSVSAASHQGFSLCLWTSVLYLHLHFAAVSKMGAKGSGFSFQIAGETHARFFRQKRYQT